MSTKGLSGTVMTFRHFEIRVETGHSIRWSEVKILGYEANWRKRKIKEDIFIEKTNNTSLLNTKPGVPMSSVYRVL